jgi:hypothetical protein
MVVPEGRAVAGDLVRTYHGDLREVIAITSAGTWLEARADAEISADAPNYLRDSIAGACALHGGTAGRERQTIARAKRRAAKPVRVRPEPENLQMVGDREHHSGTRPGA